MKSTRIPALALLLLGVLIWTCIHGHAPVIEAELQRQAVRTLAVAGFDPSIVSMSGRDASLSGTVHSDAARTQAATALRKLTAVRWVKNYLAVDPAQPSAKAVNLLYLRSTADGVDIYGTVASEALRQAVLTATPARRGGERVSADVRVKANPAPLLWPERWGPLFELIESHPPGLELLVTDTRIVIRGAVLSNGERQRLIGALNLALPALAIADRSELRPPADMLEWLQVEIDELVQDKTVQFAPDSYQIDGAGQMLLTEVFRLLERQPVAVEVAIHTDRQGDPAAEQQLSQRRADAVREYLVAQGLAAERVLARGYGSSRPVSGGDTAPERQRNRRIDFRLFQETKQ